MKGKIVLQHSVQYQDSSVWKITVIYLNNQDCLLATFYVNPKLRSHWTALPLSVLSFNFFPQNLQGNLGAIALSYPPRVRVRATVKLSAAFFHDESSITIVSSIESSITITIVRKCNSVEIWDEWYYTWVSFCLLHYWLWLCEWNLMGTHNFLWIMN